MSYVIYLRKSRADIEAEKYGEEETLSKHKKTLIGLAKKLNLDVTEIYQEVVSGETISARPKMQRLLSEVEDGIWDGVLVMEVERLARGDTQDQGIVADAFKYSNTKIITPLKIYDPHDEFDEEYFEFGLFMSRREYKTINRRLQRGRIRSAKDGKFIGSTAPFGYRRVRIKGDTGYTLEIVPDEANIIKLIFQLYTIGEIQDDGSYKRLGMFLIAQKLDSLHIPTKSSNPYWSRSTIKDILTNPVYIGMIRWGWDKVEKQKKNGEILETRRRNKDCILHKGLHESIIDDDTFYTAQNILSGKQNISVTATNVLKNPLSGLVYCEKCGRMMTRAASNSKQNYPILRCPNNHCDNVSAPIYLIEEKLLQSLAIWLKNYELIWDIENKNPNDILPVHEDNIKKMQSQLKTYKKQQSSTFDLLEQGIYDTETFTERNRILSKNIHSLEAELAIAMAQYDEDIKRNSTIQNFIPAVKNILDVYDTLDDDIEAKNRLLHSVLNKIVYLKTERNTKGNRNNANFELTLFPNIPSC